MDEFLQARSPGYRAILDRVLPGAFDQAVADAATALEQEVPAQLAWHFDVAQARQIRQPVLAVLGGESDALWPRFGETQRWLLEWLPDGEGFVLPGATHLMQVEHPSGLARGLAEFWGRHRLLT